MLLSVISLIGGLVLLVLASDWLVDGAVGLARRAGISMLVVGLTVVAYGTSFPELVVSALAALRGEADLAVGNVVGSNIANIGLVLGAAALIKPFAIGGGPLFRRDMPFLVVATLGGTYAFVDGQVGRVEGAFLLVLAVLFTWWCVRTPGHEDDNSAAADALPPPPALRNVVKLLLGMVGLFVGAHFMVKGGSEIAAAFGISERVIGLTVVAVGTSLPELAASTAGALKGYPELAVGNVVGSCLFNLSFVMGSAACIHPLGVDFAAIQWDLAVMVGLTLLMLGIFLTGRRVTRVEGGSLLGLYIGYMSWIAVTTLQGP